MENRSCVVVGVDFSESSRRAVEAATALCSRAEIPLVLIHVWNPNHLAGSGEVLAQIESWIEEQKVVLADQLDDWAIRAKEAGVEVSSRVVEGLASRAIPESARSMRAELIVVGRRGSANLAHVLLGSVSERVVHTASCPVLVIPERSDVHAAPRRLLVGVDFSAAAKDAHSAAIRLASTLGATLGLVLVHVRPPESDLWLERWSEIAFRGEYAFDREALERWAKHAGSDEVRVTLQVVEGKTEETLMHVAESEGCDWLVLGVQGRSALGAFLMGSTTDRILKLADRPILVVPRTSESPGESAG